MMTKRLAVWRNAAAMGFALGMWALLSSGCTGVVYDQPQPSAYYDYNYYPEWNVYYYPRSRVYYWNDGGRWVSGNRLPPRYVVREERWQHIQSRSQQPWLEQRPPERRGYHYRGGGRDHDYDAR